MWSRGRHFRISSRDNSKTTADSYVSGRFDEGDLKGKEYIGQIEHIIQVNYHSVQFVLLKCKWWGNNASFRHPSTNYVQDECGHMRVYARAFMPDHLEKHEPFIFPKDVNQVFLVDDRIHRDWKIVVDTEVRHIRPSLPLVLDDDIQGSSSEGAEAECMEADLIVESESDDDLLLGEAVNTEEDLVYPEEIITYTRRRRHHNPPQPIGEHVMNVVQEDEVISDDEIAPDIEDFPTLEM